VTRLHREILDILLARVANGDYPVGTLLPKEEALAEEFEVSRGTAREALRALEERRVAMVKHGRGARVQPPAEWNALDAHVARALGSGRSRRGFLREVDHCRGILEQEAAALAAEHASASERAAIRARAAELADADDVARAVQRLRRDVAMTSGNRPLAATLRALADAAGDSSGRPDVEACRRLAESVASGDREAARAAARELNPAR